MTPLLIAIALAHAPAVVPVKVCPANVGASAKGMIDFYQPFVDLYKPKRGEPPTPWGAEDYKKARGDVMAQRVRLGYAYLDAKCYKEARATFNEVWEANSVEFAPLAQQAREALNVMNSKGQ